MADHPPVSHFLCIHGHFYQPPRENPWLEAVEKEEGAAPYHDWNERILTECYAPNARSRIQDDLGRIVRVSNNYRKISFNFGPTLLSWMEGNSPVTLSAIRQADRQSVKERGGHGNALAQAYNHIILPLAEERDLLTQIRWGKADFRKRFQREAEGLWLPETAVDLKTLRALASEGIKFTILAPHQARRVRPIGQTEWQEVEGGINPRRAYRCPLGGGKKITLFFYDGALAHGIAFDNYLQNGAFLYSRLLSAFDEQESGPQLVHVATDGESYGHHRLFGDMALAFALKMAEDNPLLQVTNYGWFLEKFPPRFEVEIQENTSWSCAHGLERWRADCGCRLGGAENQQAWRGPLRQGLTRLKKELDLIFEREGAALLKDPWAARDAYIQVILDRSPESTASFFEEQARNRGIGREQRIRVLKLMEIQRCGMLMFTSCGWFFDEISGLETTQILKYACRGIQLAEEFGPSLEPLLLSYLTKAPSNDKAFGNGARVWEKKVRPHRVGLDRVAAHAAIESLYETTPQKKIYCFRVERSDQVILPQNGTHLVFGRQKTASAVTEEERQDIFTVFHFGGVDFQCFLKPSPSREGYETFRKEALDRYRTTSLGDVYDWVKGSFAPVRFSLKDLFAEERQRMINRILRERMENHLLLLEGWIKEETGTILRLNEINMPLPEPMRAALTLIFERLLEKGLREALSSLQGTAALHLFLERSRELNFPLPKARIQERVQRKTAEAIRKIDPFQGGRETLKAVVAILELCQAYAVPVSLWHIQNNFLDLCRTINPVHAVDTETYLTFARFIEIPPEVIEWETT